MDYQMTSFANVYHRKCDKKETSGNQQKMKDEKLKNYV